MAIKFIEITYEKLNNNKTNNARVEIAVDSAADLVTSHKGINFTQGSIAWDISTDDFYGLNSNSEWIKQGGGGGSATLIEKTITANDTYNASDDGVDGYSKVVANIPPHFSRIRVSVPYQSSGEVVLKIVNMYTSTDGTYNVSTSTTTQKAVLCNPAKKIEIGNMLQYTAVVFTPDDNFDGFYVNGSKITPTGDDIGSKNSSDTYFGTTTGAYGHTTGINIIKTSDPQFSFAFDIY